MRAQAAVIGIALFFIAMIIMGAVYLSLVSKTMKLLDASRKEIVLLTRKAEENLKITWGWEQTYGTMGYPVLIINNTGPIPVHIVRVILEVRQKQPGQPWWPEIIEGPWIIAKNIDLPVGGSATIKANHELNRKLIEDWYRNNMTRILEARILTSTGNIFITIYVPKPPHSSLKPGMSTILFYWSAQDWMDMENNEWWHGDRLGYIRMTPPDEAWTIDSGTIEIPAWETYGPRTISFEFLVYLPGTDSNGYVLGSKNFLVLATEIMAVSEGFANWTPINIRLSLSILSLDGQTVYSVESGNAKANTTLGGVPLTIYLRLDPTDPVYGIVGRQVERLASVPKDVDPGWYIVKVNITFSGMSNGDLAKIGLKSLFLYISNENLW